MASDVNENLSSDHGCPDEEEVSLSKGVLHIVSTPIGNLEDITKRAIDILASMDVICCEDTRRSGKLLKRIQSNAKLISLHKFSEAKRIETIMDLLDADNSVAIISDAGTPVISDPGYRVVAKARQKGHKVTIAPGPSSVTSAMALSGFDGSRFTFMGYAPRKSAARRAFLQEISLLDHPCVIFETPKRLLSFLEDLTDILPLREAVVMRELTKLHEEIVSGKPQEILDKFKDRESIKGEIVLVIQGETNDQEELDMDGIVKGLIHEGFTGKRLANEAGNRFKVKKGEAYETYLKLKEKDKKAQDLD